MTKGDKKHLPKNLERPLEKLFNILFAECAFFVGVDHTYYFLKVLLFTFEVLLYPFLQGNNFSYKFAMRISGYQSVSERGEILSVAKK